MHNKRKAYFEIMYCMYSVFAPHPVCITSENLPDSLETKHFFSVIVVKYCLV